MHRPKARRRPPGSRRPTPTLALALGGVLGAGLAVPATAPVAVADDGLDESTHSRYELRAEAGEVTADVTTTIRNTTPPAGSYLYYYDSYGIAVPAGATDVQATSAGAALAVELRATDDPSTALAVASFPALHYGSSRTVEWSFVVPGEPVRSRDATRVGPGYATFAVQATGDPGEVSVEVELPADMTFDATSDAFAAEPGGSTTTYRATRGTGDQGIWAVVSARDPGQADERTVEVDGDTLTVQGFPGDERWLRFASRQLRQGLPALEELVGQPWPGGLKTIREDVSPQATGYAWFDTGADEIVVPEDLDAALLFHELSHAWYNPDEIGGRWLYEGLAEVVARRVAADVDARSGPPRETPDRGADVALPLTAWSEGEDSAQVESYAYAASYTAVRRLLRDLDDEAVAEVLAAAYAGESAYEPPGDTSHHRGRTQWQRFLDLVEVRGGVTGGAKVYRQWVVDGEQRAELGARRSARAAYVALDEADGGWQPPRGLRGAMTGWEFADAKDVRAALGDAPGLAGQVQAAAREAGLPDPAAVRAAYQDARTAQEYADLAGTLPRALTAVTEVGSAADAASADRDVVSALGAAVLGLDASTREARAALDAGELDEATSLADGVQQRAGWATAAGAALVLLALGLLGGTAAAVRRRRGRRTDRLGRDGPARELPDHDVRL